MPRSGPLLLQQLLANDQVAIADLILNKATPWNDFRLYPEVIADGEISSSKKTIGQVWADASIQGLEIHAGNLINAAAQSKDGFAQTIQSMHAQCLQLKNSGDKFKDVCCKDGEIRKWLEENMLDHGRQIYMVVGKYLLTDTQVQEVEISAGSKFAKATAPNTSFSPSEANVGAGAGTNRRAYQHLRYNAPGSQIFAIEYRQVRLRWLDRKQVDKMSLSQKPNQWYVFTGGKAQRTAFEENEKGIEDGRSDFTHDETDDSEAEYVIADLVDDLDVIPFGEYQD